MSDQQFDGLREHSVVESDFVYHTELPTTRLSQVLDRVLVNIGFVLRVPVARRAGRDHHASP
ncbi:MAG: hypothetical protein U5L06_15750 [Rhodovibrio sp.]|nr:hypothetical protein [Rhodovibrio sp.]